MAGTRFGSHSRYKAKHPKRGPVPKFMEQQVRLESPREELPVGWAIMEVEVIERDRPVTYYRLHHRGTDTGKYARDWNKAVSIAKRHAKKGARKNPSRHNPSRRNPARGNPMDSPGMRAYQAYMAEKKAAGWSHKKALGGWRRRKTATAKSGKIAKGVVGLALSDIYAAADRLLPGFTSTLGHEYPGSEFLHSSGALDSDEGRKTIQVELPRSHDTRSRKGWSTWNVDTPDFIAALRGIQRKYRKHGLKMTVRVKNNPRS